MTLLFYLCIDIIAIFFALMADKYVVNNRNIYSQSDKRDWGIVRIKVYKLFFLISFITLFFVVAFRDNVGADYNGYKNAFLHVNAGNLSIYEKRWLSIGYRILCQIIGIISHNNYILMFAVVGGITIYFFYRAIYEVSIHWGLSVFLFISFCLYYQCFNQVRQMMAMAITTYAYRYIQEEKSMKFFLCVGIATLFHTSAIVMLAVYIVRNWKMCFKNYCLYIGGSIAGYVGFDLIIYILSYTNYGKTYLQWAKYNTSFELSSILNLGVRIILLVGCLIFAKDTIKRKASTLGLYNAVIICTIFQILTLKSYLFGRITTYFFCMYIFLIPEVMETIKRCVDKISYRIIQIVLIILLIAYHFVYYFSSSGASGSGYEIYNSLLFGQ